MGKTPAAVMERAMENIALAENLETRQPHLLDEGLKEEGLKVRFLKGMNRGYPGLVKFGQIPFWIYEIVVLCCGGSGTSRELKGVTCPVLRRSFYRWLLW